VNLKAVLMVNLTVVMVSVFMNHGHATAMLIAGILVQMKLTAVNLKVVPMVNLTVVMVSVSMAHGHVTAMVTAQMAQMKPTVVK